MSSPDSGLRAEAVVDLDAIAANTAALRAHVGGRPLMAVVKADGYGHGIVMSARAARAGGADWLGVALLDEAMELRASGDDGPVLCWLAVPGERFGVAVSAGVDIAASSVGQLDEIAAAAAHLGLRARVQLMADTGLSRGGAIPADWPALVEAARRHRDAGRVEVTGVWSHLACADQPDHPSVAGQLVAFEKALAEAEGAGLEIPLRHLANSPATLAIPESWYDMVRPGIALYGVSPFTREGRLDGRRGGRGRIGEGKADTLSAARLSAAPPSTGRLGPGQLSPIPPPPVPLVAAMRLTARVAIVERVAAGTGVSYGHTYVTGRETTLALVPLGYADGIPLHASGSGPVLVNGRAHTVAGRVCMDQFVVDVGDDVVRTGDPVVLFGGGPDEPRAADWATAAGTIGYEIVARIGPRVRRRYVGSLLDAEES